MCVFLEPPSIPVGPLGHSDVSTSGVTLQWRPPETDGGTSLKSYVIERREVARLKWQKVATIRPETTQYRVTDLTEGYSYMFRVLAQNAEGISEPLESDQSVSIQRPAGTLEFRDVGEHLTRKLNWRREYKNLFSHIQVFTRVCTFTKNYVWQLVNIFLYAGFSFIRISYIRVRLSFLIE